MGTVGTPRARRGRFRNRRARVGEPLRVVVRHHQRLGRRAERRAPPYQEVTPPRADIVRHHAPARLGASRVRSRVGAKKQLERLRGFRPRTGAQVQHAVVRLDAQDRRRDHGVHGLASQDARAVVAHEPLLRVPQGFVGGELERVLVAPELVPAAPRQLARRRHDPPRVRPHGRFRAQHVVALAQSLPHTGGEAGHLRHAEGHGQRPAQVREKVRPLGLVDEAESLRSVIRLEVRDSVLARDGRRPRSRGSGARHRSGNIGALRRRRRRRHVHHGRVPLHLRFVVPAVIVGLVPEALLSRIRGALERVAAGQVRRRGRRAAALLPGEHHRAAPAALAPHRGDGAGSDCGRCRHDEVFRETLRVGNATSPECKKNVTSSLLRGARGDARRPSHFRRSFRVDVVKRNLDDGRGGRVECSDARAHIASRYDARLLREDGGVV